MSLPRFFAPEIVRPETCLDPDESYHLGSVWRLKAGDSIFLINGQGEEWRARVLRVERGRVWVCPEVLHRTEAEPEFELEILIPLLKGGRTEFLVEKATELGATRILPFVSQYAVAKPGDRTGERLWKRTIQALKQSGRLWFPAIESPRPLEEVLKTVRSRHRYFACEKYGPFLSEVFQVFEIFPRRIALASGPEGGFSEKEIAAFRKAGFKAVSLGPYILRAETAAFFMLAIWRYQVLKSLSSFKEAVKPSV